MRNPFSDEHCKTNEEKLVELCKIHANFVNVNSDYMPDDLVKKGNEFHNLMLKYIWKWQNERKDGAK